MYERFTDRSRKVMQLANQEAQRFNHEYIGTEHILLGLVKEGSGVAANVLINLDVSLLKIRQEIEKVVQTGPEGVTMGRLPQTPRAKKVIEYAIEEARALKHNYVGTEHLLLGVLREAEGVGAQILVNLGLRLEMVRQEILNLLGHTRDASLLLPTRTGRTPAIDSLGQDLTQLSDPEELHLVPEYEAEVEQVLEVLNCQTWNRLLLVGESQLGTLDIVRSVAPRLAASPAHPEVKRRLVAIQPSALLGVDPQAAHSRLIAVFNEARRAKDVILFFNDLHLLPTREPELWLVFQAAFLAGYQPPLLAATTAEGYRQLQESNHGLLSLFEVLVLAPPERSQTVEILRGLRDRYEAHHRVRIDDVALAAVVELAATLPSPRSLAERASLLLDRACSRLRLRAPCSADVRSLDEEIERLNQQKEQAVADADFAGAAKIRDQTEPIKRERQRLLNEMVVPLDAALIREVAQAMNGRSSRP